MSPLSSESLPDVTPAPKYHRRTEEMGEWKALEGHQEGQAFFWESSLETGKDPSRLSCISYVHSTNVDHVLLLLLEDPANRVFFRENVTLATFILAGKHFRIQG